MLKLTGLGVAFALAALAALGASPAVAAKSKSPNCKRSKSSTVAENRSARVFTRRDARHGDPHGTALVGCWKKSGRARRLADAFDDEYVTSAAFDLVGLRGRFVAFYGESVDVSC